MNVWIRTVFVVAALCAMLVGCKKEELPPPKYPFHRVLTNAEGTTLDVVIVGRTATQLIFTKSGDEKQFNYSIAKLSEEDREFAESLPIGEVKEESAWIKSKRDELRRVNEKIDSYESQINDSKGSSMRARSLKRELDKLEDEKKELESSIKDDLASGR